MVGLELRFGFGLLVCLGLSGFGLVCLRCLVLWLMVLIVWCNLCFLGVWIVILGFCALGGVGII